MNADSITGTAGRVQISGCGPVTVPPAPAPADGGAGPACGKTVPSDGVAAAQAAQDQLEQSLRLPVAGTPSRRARLRLAPEPEAGPQAGH